MWARHASRRRDAADVAQRLVGREGIEPPQSKTADLQSAELTTCSTYPTPRQYILTHRRLQSTDAAANEDLQRPMYARLTRFQGPPDRLEEGIFLLHEQVIPRARLRNGQVSGYWLLDRASGQGVVVSLWETEAAMLASEAAAEQLRQAVVDHVGGTVLSVEQFEVVGET